MTYEEAKMQIQAIPEKIWDQLSEPDREAMEMAFSALQVQEAKTQLSAEGTTSDLISRQDAIDALWEIRQEEISDGRKFHDYCSLSTAVDVIKDLPSAQPESEERKAESAQNVPKEDLISRNAAIDAECEVCQIAPKKERGHNCTYYVHGCKEIECLRALPSAQPERCEDCENFSKTRLLIPQPERKKGKWTTKSTNGEMFDVCSVCGYVEWDNPRNFCPNCGADMREEQDG